MNNRNMPAKPQPLATDNEGNIHSSVDKSMQDSGLTKLEYAAIHIAKGMLSNSHDEAYTKVSFTNHMKRAVSVAHALFDELEKQ